MENRFNSLNALFRCFTELYPKLQVFKKAEKNPLNKYMLKSHELSSSVGK